MLVSGPTWSLCVSAWLTCAATSENSAVSSAPTAPAARISGSPLDPGRSAQLQQLQLPGSQALPLTQLGQPSSNSSSCQDLRPSPRHMLDLEPKFFFPCVLVYNKMNFFLSTALLKGKLEFQLLDLTRWMMKYNFIEIIKCGYVC